MIDRTHPLPVAWQCRILELARSTAYYTPQPTSPEDLALMRRLARIWPSTMPAGRISRLTGPRPM
jgi:hypothetical protein